MPAEPGLLRAILDAPDDDAPRLVYADWLDDHGQPDRAELIRTQVELARLAEDSPRRREVAWRARELLDRHGAEWARALPGELHDWRFSRGFVESAGLMGPDLEADAAALFDATPVRRLWVTELLGNVDPLQDIPTDNRLLALDLCGDDLNVDSLETLAELPNLPGLRELGLLFNEIDDVSVEHLCQHPFFQRLSLLRLGANPFSDAGRQALREHFGERVSFACERDDDHLYAIQNGYIFSAGFGRDFTQILAVDSDTEMEAALFDHAGNRLRTERRPIEQRSGAGVDERRARREAARQAWLDELGFQPATIQVKRFAEGGWIHGFCEMWAEVFDRPGHPERASARKWLDDWLVHGMFAWGGGPGICWLDRTGQVTDT
jgi:uncharacterized protein (TIGR02996 family)